MAPSAASLRDLLLIGGAGQKTGVPYQSGEVRSGMNRKVSYCKVRLG